jgi:D-alanine-D-alanine ligase
MKLNIAVVAGGNSGEYKISINSSAIVTKHLDQSKYAVFPVHIRGTEWTYTDAESNKEYQVDKNDFSVLVDGKKIVFDCVFNAIHGTPGEDGKLQGYFDMLGLPYTSCGNITSALTFNKSFCNRVVASFGVKTSRSIHLFIKNDPDYEYIGKELTFPVFVKPNCGGSSVGMSKVYTVEKLPEAVQLAYTQDTEVLIEEFVAGREITCGVLRIDGKITSLPLTEVISKKDYFDYEAKYSDGLSEEIVPAVIPQHRAEQCAAISEQLYQKLNCRGVVRFDYIMTETDFNFLEVNTVPGLSAASIVPKMAAAAGYTLSEFYDFLISDAMHR